MGLLYSAAQYFEVCISPNRPMIPASSPATASLWACSTWPIWAIWVRISMKPALENPSPRMSRCVTPQLMMGQGLKLIPQIA